MTASTGIYDVGDIYDLIYEGRGKDYRAEASTVGRHIRARNPEADTLLDVGCGTGGHLRYFAQEFGRVEGVDLSEGMLAVCRRACPDVPVSLGDMRSFRTGRRHDAVVSLFSVVGNLVGTKELDATLATFAAHLNPGGVAVLEPWWFPDNFTPGHVGASVSTADGTTVARVSHTVRDSEGASRMEVHYTVAERDKGIRHFSDTHVMALYSRAEYESAFEQAGFTVEYLNGEFGGNGLFVGVLGAGR